MSDCSFPSTLTHLQHCISNLNFPIQNHFRANHQSATFKKRKMKSLLLLALAPLSMAWVFNTTRSAWVGERDLRCQTVEGKNQDHWFAIDGKERGTGTDGVSVNCCAYLYKDKSCSQGFANERHCGQFSGRADEGEFRSFGVYCVKRKPNSGNDNPNRPN